MYELIQISDHDFYIDSPTKIGLIKINNNDVVLIDSGNDKSAGKKVYRILEENSWHLHTIFNTHSHADHIGGNHFLQEKTGCTIYANNMECTYSNTPLLEPIGLYGGLPFRDLKHKFLLAQESRVLPLTKEVLPEGIELLKLPGHSFDMVGFKTKDGTAYLADSLSSEETLTKYGISYLWNPTQALDTLTYLQTLDAAQFVPSHAPTTTDIQNLVHRNIQAITEVKERILALCNTPTTFEKLLKQIFDAYQLQMSTQQYALIGSTIRSYLSCLHEEKSITVTFKDNEMLWQALSADMK